MSLRERLEEDRLLMAIGAWDAITASMAEQAGAEAIYMSGSCVATSVTAGPDVGMTTMTEMATRAHQISGAIDVPLIADADTGYGNALNVQRTVEEYERAGVDAIQLEDQVFPKKCGHFEGKDVIGAPEFAAKIEAAVDARESDDFLVVARTDAIAVHGLDEAVRRAQLYKEAGADVLFVEAPTGSEQMRTVTDNVPGPLMANLAAKGKTPPLTDEELEDIGYDVCIYPSDAFKAALKTVRETYETLVEDRSQRNILDDMMEWETRDEITDLAGVNEREDRYDAAADRYAERYEQL